MKNTIIYAAVFLATVGFGIGSMAFMAKTPLQTRIITLDNGYKTVKLYGMAHNANESFYKEVFKDFEDQEQQDYEIMTEGYNTFETAEGKLVELNLLSKTSRCDNIIMENTNLISQQDYIENNQINYKTYLKDINVYQMFIMAKNKSEKNYICFELDNIEKIRVYFKMVKYIETDNTKYSLLYNRDINLVNEIILSPKRKVAAYYGDDHLTFTTELLEKVGFEVKKIEYINAF